MLGQISKVEQFVSSLDSHRPLFAVKRLIIINYLVFAYALKKIRLFLFFFGFFFLNFHSSRLIG